MKPSWVSINRKVDFLENSIVFWNNFFVGMSNNSRVVAKSTATKCTKDKIVDLMCSSNVKYLAGTLNMDSILILWAKKTARISTQIRSSTSNYVRLNPIFFLHQLRKIFIRLEINDIRRINAGI